MNFYVFERKDEHRCLQLQIADADLVLTETLGKLAADEFGNTSVPADPFSSKVLVFLERVVNGFEPRATACDEWFADALLVCFHLVIRFGNAQNFHLKEVCKLLKGGSGTPWGDKSQHRIFCVYVATSNMSRLILPLSHKEYSSQAKIGNEMSDEKN